MAFPSFSNEALQRKAQVETAPILKGKQSLLDYIDHQRIPGVSIAVINDYEIEWAEGYGVRETGQPDAVTSETLFQACSISKAVTAIAALRLVERGQLDLDSDINTFLTSWKVPPQKKGADQPAVTLRQLLSHTAGMSVAWYPGYHREQDIPTLYEVLESSYVSNTPEVRITTTPGESFRYSGGGYCVVQQALVDVTRKPFPELMRELVFEPVEMQRSTYEQPLPAEKWHRAATAHRPGGKPVPGKWHIYPEMAAAGLWTTPTDLARLALDLQCAEAGKPSRLLSLRMVNELLTPQSKAGERGMIGLGVFIHGKGNYARFGHAGDNAGFNCQWLSLVHKGQGCVIMTNSDEGWLITDKLPRIIAQVYEWPDISAKNEKSGSKNIASKENFL